MSIATDVLGLLFGWRQWRINRQDQFKLHSHEKRREFFDAKKRREIFDAIMEYVKRAVEKGTVTDKDVHNVARRTKEVRHLFDHTIQKLREQLIREGVKEMVDQDRMKRGTSPNREQTIQSWRKRMMWFNGLLTTLPEQFDPYLKVKK